MNALEALIREIVAAKGPLGLDAYMELALQHPAFGYYRVRDPLGRAGDFVTAPEVSQMFGEMIGVWCAEAWRALGMPSPFALVEFGPGHGSMMADALRATAHVAGFHEALRLCLVESDAALRARQREVLGAYRPVFLEGAAEIPAMPLIAVANEFFDALPVRQFESTFRGWAERVVTVADDRLAFALRPLGEPEMALIPDALRDARPGTVFECAPQAQAVMRQIARLLADRRGAMLIVDYGFTARSGAGTVQAVAGHARADVLERPGEVDLTAHVDFTALAAAAQAGGASVSPVIGQGAFLKNMGIEIRADALKKRATPAQAEVLESALRRLTDAEAMGELFKVLDVRG